MIFNMSNNDIQSENGVITIGNENTSTIIMQSDDVMIGGVIQATTLYNAGTLNVYEVTSDTVTVSANGNKTININVDRGEYVKPIGIMGVDISRSACYAWRCFIDYTTNKANVTVHSNATSDQTVYVKILVLYETVVSA